MCHSYLLALKFVPDWFITNMIEKRDSVVFSDDYVVFDVQESDFATFFTNGIDLNSVSLLILILMMKTSIIVIQLLLLMLGLWAGITSNNAKQLKRR